MPIDKYMEKLSPQVRIFALAAALAAVGELAFVFMSGRGAVAESELAAPLQAAAVAKKAKAPVVNETAPGRTEGEAESGSRRRRRPPRPSP